MRILPCLALLGLVLLSCPSTRADGPGLASRSLAMRVGGAVEEDPVSGRVTIRSGGHVVHLCAGIARAMVDDRVEVLPGAPFASGDDLLLPYSAASAVEGFLRVPIRTVPIASSAPRPVAPVPSRSASAWSGGGRVVLDAGHGGPLPGAKGISGTLEKNITLDVTRRLERLLEARGWQVSMTRDGDRVFSSNQRTDLDERAKFTRRLDPDVFVSIHANHASDRNVRGFEVFVGNSGHATKYTGASRALAQQIERTLRGLGIPDRGVKSAGFYVVKWADCPAVLVETEFLSNPAGERLLTDATQRQRIAEALADALGRWWASRARS